MPIAVLRAISLTETGRQSNGEIRPWPWTVNMEGKGVWFDTQEQALNFANENFRRGARSFDVGCFQLNYKWHGQAFASIRDMFDPTANATYAAGYLRDLYEEKGNWVDAAGAYHSRTPKFANRYKKRFQRLLSEISGRPDTQLTLAASSLAASPPRQEQRENRFPLLQGGRLQPASLGSLVPASAGAGGPRLIGGN